MKRPSNHQRRLVILTLAAMTFGLAFYGGSKYKSQETDKPPITGVLIIPPSPLPRLEDNSDTAAGINETALRGHWSLLMLDPHRDENRSPGLTRLLQIHNRLADAPSLQQQLHYLYLPIAPDKTKQQSLTTLGDNIRGLTFQPSQREELFHLFGVDPQGQDAALYLIDPEAKLHALFTPREDAANIAEDLTTLITTPPVGPR